MKDGKENNMHICTLMKLNHIKQNIDKMNQIFRGTGYKFEFAQRGESYSFHSITVRWCDHELTFRFRTLKGVEDATTQVVNHKYEFYFTHGEHLEFVYDTFKAHSGFEPKEFEFGCHFITTDHFLSIDKVYNELFGDNDNSDDGDDCSKDIIAVELSHMTEHWFNEM